METQLSRVPALDPWLSRVMGLFWEANSDRGVIAAGFGATYQPLTGRNVREVIRLDGLRGPAADDARYLIGALDRVFMAYHRDRQKRDSKK